LDTLVWCDEKTEGQISSLQGRILKIAAQCRASMGLIDSLLDFAKIERET